MTAQTPERIIIDGRPRELYANPLYRLLASRRLDLCIPASGSSTACYRRYVGTWEIRNGALHLVHLNMMVPDEEPLAPELRQRLFRAVPCKDFPIMAHWFNGKLRIAIGRRLVYSHHGWSHWFERERVITFFGGKVLRDREVDTGAILERQMSRNPAMRDRLAGHDREHLERPGPLIWFDNDAEDWALDWWPRDYRPFAA